MNYVTNKIFQVRCEGGVREGKGGGNCYRIGLLTS